MIATLVALHLVNTLATAIGAGITLAGYLAVRAHEDGGRKRRK